MKGISVYTAMMRYPTVYEQNDFLMTLLPPKQKEIALQKRAYLEDEMELRGQLSIIIQLIYDRC